MSPELTRNYHNKRCLIHVLICWCCVFVLFLYQSNCKAEEQDEDKWETSDYSKVSELQKKYMEMDKEGPREMIKLALAGKPQEKEKIFCINPTLSPKDIFPNWKLEKTEKIIWKRYDMTEKVQSFWLTQEHRFGEKMELIKLNAVVRISECDSISSAHESLVNIFANTSAPHTPFNDIGDIGFILGGDISHVSRTNHFDYTRGNLRISVACITSPYEIMRDESFKPHIEELAKITKDMAVKIDNLIKSIPPKESDSDNKPSITEFRLTKDKNIQIDEEIELNFTVSDPNHKKLSYKIYTSGGEICRKERKFYFSTKKTGEYKILLCAINEDNLVSLKELTLKVVGK